MTVEFKKNAGGRKNAFNLKKREEALKEKESKSGPTPAMILPFPHKEGGKVELLDLSKIKGFFSNLKDAFPVLKAPVSRKKSKSSGTIFCVVCIEFYCSELTSI